MPVPSEIFDDVKADVAANQWPKLSDPEIQTIIERNTKFVTWTPNTAYAPGSVVVPTVRTGVLWRCTNAGTSGATEPEWQGIFDPQYYWWFQDNDIWWSANGPDTSPELYNLRQAKYECWMRKAGMAAGSFAYNAGDAGGAAPQTVADQCRTQARVFRPISFR